VVNPASESHHGFQRRRFDLQTPVTVMLGHMQLLAVERLIGRRRKQSVAAPIVSGVVAKF
jgi:hypothetical protein